MAAPPEDISVAIDELETAIAEIESRLESTRAERDEAKARQVELEIENAGLRRALSLTRDHQAASADILHSIAGASGDAEHSLHQIAETTMRLFGAPSATIHIAKGDGWSQVIRVGDSSKRVGAGVPESQLKIGGRNMPGTIVGDNRQVHIPDLDNVDPDIADWPGLPHVRAAGTKSMSGSPLRHEGKAIGALIVYRDRLAPFTDEEMALQQSFADQAAIAIENARLFNETKEALERQTATADILKVIAGSPSDTTPVFQAIATSANRLLGAFATAVFRVIDDTVYLAAHTPVSPVADAALRADFPKPVDEFEGFRLAQHGKPFPIPDTEENAPEDIRRIARLHGFRSMLFVPLMNGDMAIGIISVTRRETGAFVSHHIQLLQTFADQAVIAIENSRLFNETREALERQTATADILKVIASSPSDVQPVFEAIATNSKQLIGGFSTAVFRFVDGMAQLAAYTPINPAADEILNASFPRSTAGLPFFESATGGKVVQEVDTEANPDERLRNLARARGFRSTLLSPLMSKGEPIGVIVVTRKEPGTFAAHHVQLLQTFADQAVIAIENVRLFDEVQAKTRDLTEALTLQTATADVLKVISRSAFDLQKVLDTLSESATQLCEADIVIIHRRVGEGFRGAASFGLPEDHHRAVMEIDHKPGRGSLGARVLLESAPVLIDDAEIEPEYTFGAFQRRLGLRSMLGVPLTRDGAAIGLLLIFRKRVQPFSQRHVDLATTFADQAVIAMENVRLFDEVQARTRDLSESLQQQTATADVLKVISRSAFDLETVMNTLARSASELCGADMSGLFLRENDVLIARGVSDVEAKLENLVQQTPVPIDDQTYMGRALLTGAIINLADVAVA